jgi:hypothetical protein
MWIIVYLDINLHSCPTQLFDAGKHSEGQIYTLCDPIPVTSFQKLFSSASPRAKEMYEPDNRIRGEFHQKQKHRSCLVTVDH